MNTSIRAQDRIEWREAPLTDHRPGAGALMWLVLSPLPCHAQRPTCAADTVLSQADAATGASRREEFALGGAALAYVAAAAGDTRFRAFTSAHRTSALDHAASAVDPLGQAGVWSRADRHRRCTEAARDRPLSDAAARIALTYVAADAIESILKPVIGRHRPDDGGGPWRFRPFVNDAELAFRALRARRARLRAGDRSVARIAQSRRRRACVRARLARWSGARLSGAALDE